jgi:hypothetical protein
MPVTGFKPVTRVSGGITQYFSTLRHLCPSRITPGILTAFHDSASAEQPLLGLPQRKDHGVAIR